MCARRALTNAQNIKWVIAKSARRPAGVVQMNAGGWQGGAKAFKAPPAPAQPPLDAGRTIHLLDHLDLPIEGRSRVRV